MAVKGLMLTEWERVSGVDSSPAMNGGLFSHTLGRQWETALSKMVLLTLTESFRRPA